MKLEHGKLSVTSSYLKGFLNKAIYSADGYGGLKSELRYCANSRLGEDTIFKHHAVEMPGALPVFVIFFKYLLSLPHNRNKTVQKGPLTSMLAAGKEKGGDHVIIP